MSEKLRRCRKELAAALDRASEDITMLPELSSVPPREVIGFSSSTQIEQFRNCSPNYSLVVLCSDFSPTRFLLPCSTVRLDPRQAPWSYRKATERFSIEFEAPIFQDVLETFGNSYMQTLEDLAAKLEFENVLNRVCSHQSPCKGEDADVSDREDLIRVLDTVLDMEQDFNLMVYDK